MENENVIIQKFLECDNNKIEILLELIIQCQYRKMMNDINNVIRSMELYGCNTPRSIEMATNVGSCALFNLFSNFAILYFSLVIVFSIN